MRCAEGSTTYQKFIFNHRLMLQKKLILIRLTKKHLIWKLIQWYTTTIGRSTRRAMRMVPHLISAYFPTRISWRTSSRCANHICVVRAYANGRVLLDIPYFFITLAIIAVVTPHYEVTLTDFHWIDTLNKSYSCIPIPSLSILHIRWRKPCTAATSSPLPTNDSNSSALNLDYTCCWTKTVRGTPRRVFLTGWV